MTTHHTIEVDRVIEVDRWCRALELLVGDYPELSSRVVGWARARRVVVTSDAAAIWERVVRDSDGSQDAIERWLAEPIDPRSELPLRVRVAPGRVAEQAITLSLHHSVCDGVGALVLFDRLLALASGGPVRARRSKPLGCYADAARPPLRRLSAKLRQLRRPAAQLIDLTEHDAGKQLLALRMIEPSLWAALGRLAHAVGASRTTALWHAVGTVAARQRLDDADLPVRMIAGVDLRAHLGIEEDALGNWLGTLEHEHSERESLEELHAALLDARQPAQAVLTPALLAGLATLPGGIARAMFRRIDSDAWPCPFSLMLSHIRPQEQRCWPVALRPRQLWCASTLPRKPGLGLTFTSVGDRVCVAAACQASLLRRATLERLLDAVLEELRARVALAVGAQAGQRRSS